MTILYIHVDTQNKKDDNVPHLVQIGTWNIDNKSVPP